MAKQRDLMVLLAYKREISLKERVVKDKKKYDRKKEKKKLRKLLTDASL